LRLAVALAVILCSSCSRPVEERQPEVAKPVEVPAQFRVRFETSKGPFVVEVVRDWAPRGADRFHELVRKGFYDGARFYRVRPKFVVQWGISPDPKVNELWKQLKMPDDPVTQSNLRGFISYATDGPATRTTEVFVNLVDNKRLDSRGFTPFGRVVEGMEVVDSFYSGYGEVQPMGGGPDPVKMQTLGDSYVEQSFPRLDKIVAARIE
jgi:peptidyl-prolyl cis-trans isomerase A (cyclophilin A)